MLDYTTLKVGDQVAVAYPGGWSIMNQGVYRVVKANKMKVIVERITDGYLREFSVKRRCEMGALDRFRAAYLETVAEQEARIERRQQEAAKRQAWSAVEQAARDKDFTALQKAMAVLESRLDPVPF